MKKLTLLLGLTLLTTNAIAGDGYQITSHGLISILQSDLVKNASSPNYIKSIRLFGEVNPGAMTYILELERPDILEAPRFCLEVSVETRDLSYQVVAIKKWPENSRLCAMN